MFDPHLDEDGIIFDVAARLQETLRHKQRTPGGDVHLCPGTSEAAAVRVGLKGITQVFPRRTLVHQHQSHLTDTDQIRFTKKHQNLSSNLSHPGQQGAPKSTLIFI